MREHRHSFLMRGVLALYVLAAVVMLLAAFGPLKGVEGPPGPLRALFAIAAAACAAIAMGSYRTAPWARKLALGLHALVTLAAAAGLISRLAGAPLFAGDISELIAKTLVHALALWLWSSRWMARQLAPC